jgi:hypothetical protein
MFDTRPLNVLRSELDKLKQDQISFIANGGAKDFAEYRHVCGIIRGLGHADEIVKDLVLRIDINDE